MQAGVGLRYAGLRRASTAFPAMNDDESRQPLATDVSDQLSHLSRQSARAIKRKLRIPGFVSDVNQSVTQQIARVLHDSVVILRVNACETGAFAMT